MNNTVVIICLLLLTATSSIVSGATAVIPVILGLAAIKFLLVSFQFMEVKHAHGFWKAAVVVIIFTLTAAICIIKV